MMKRICSSLTAACLLAAGCGNKETRDFIPGQYTTNYSHKYAAGNDTVVIEPFGSNGYTITRNTTFSRIRDGKLQPEEQTTRIYSGIYNAQSATVTETRGGSMLSFDPAHSEMKWGTAIYRKIP